MIIRNEHKRSMKKAIILKLMLIVALMLAFVPAAAYADDASAAEHNLIAEVQRLLAENHLSGVSNEQLIEAAIQGMVESLDDPYTTYMSADDWGGYQDSIEQNYVGIGIRLGEDENGVYALEVFPDSPAYEAGIIKGDYITAVNGTSVEDKSTDEIVSMITGEASTEVEVTVTNSGKSSTYTMTRRSVQIPNVVSERVGDYGYIRISTFSLEADKQVEEIMVKMKRANIQGLVIDLRGNPGGYLNTVGYIFGEFMENGVLMQTRDRSGENHPVSVENGYSVDFPVVILINEQSASGSEVLAGAMQDHQLGTIVGVQSYGKGSVQSIFPLSNGGMLKTTVQEYLTPNGHPVNGVGITPDIEVQGSVPQLLTAFRTAGMTDLTLTSNGGNLRLNGIEFQDVLDFVVHNDRVFVHSRVLASIAGMQTEWNGAEQQVVLIDEGDGRQVFHVHSPEVVQQHGKTYLDLKIFAERVDGFDWNYEEGTLTMSIQANQ